MTPNQRQILVCQYTTCLERGGAEVLAALQEADLPEDVEIVPSGCLGQCNLGPNLRLIPEETWYCRLQSNDIPQIVEQHLKGGQRVSDKLHPRIHFAFLTP
ncbi:(2Fe-2S) ferredoxin domain-containing protein [Spirulina subsalsa]|uniref:(2Fe-2S) ferredoxin domain-containing protein n=1 Tax=Spirulina subsalsa TaxID=54311 RepID=UPI0002E9DCE5|nr:(2Fe-2S) ferredoxin domain-containing protein [Spirulina subsalsa]